MTEQRVLQNIEEMRREIQEGRRRLELIGMRREERAAIEQQLDCIYAQLDLAREALVKLHVHAS